MIKRQHFLLDSDTVSKELIGYQVTIGIGNITGESTTQAIIEDFDDKKLHLRVGNKLKKFDYDPHGIVLSVYQFDKGIHFVSQAEMDEYESEKSQNQQKEKSEKSNA